MVRQSVPPAFAFLHHVSLPCCDIAESKKFYIEGLGRELIRNTQHFDEVRIADIVIGM